LQFRIAESAACRRPYSCQVAHTSEFVQSHVHVFLSLVSIYSIYMLSRLVACFFKGLEDYYDDCVHKTVGLLAKKKKAHGAQTMFHLHACMMACCKPSSWSIIIRKADKQKLI